MKNKLISRRVLILLFLLIMGTVSTALAAETIKIGVAGSHTGDLASYGIPTIHAAELVVKKVNAQGGIAGKKLVLLI
ncbi:MAG: ABC transporter substrate-binding protein, partial [Deltaproteobacteria bacterium]|nr:ABC transporter substrate-binding protein [Deltaproteobacteria bacterium]